MSTKASAKKAGKENAPPRIVNKLIAETEDMEDTKYDDSFDALDPLDGGEEDAITQSSKSRPLTASQTLKSNKPSSKSSTTAIKQVGKSSKAGTRAAGSKARNTADQRDENEVEDFEIELNAIDEEEKAEGAARSAKGRTAKLVGKSSGRPAESVDVAVAGDDDISVEDKAFWTTKVAELERQLTAARNNLRRSQEERDAFAKQFEQLSAAQPTDADRALRSYKQKAEDRAAAQSEVIATLTQLNEQLQAKLKHVGKETSALPVAQSSGPQPSAQPQTQSSDDTLEKVKAAAAKEVRVLKEQMAQLKKEVQAKDEQYATLKRDYDTEVALSKEAAQKRAALTPAPAAVAADESAKDTQLIKLYEDLTNLTAPNIKIKDGGAGKEVTFVCVQTMDSKSLNFKLKCYNEWIADDSKQGGHYNRQIAYEPLHLENEQDNAFIERLGLFKTPFAFPRDQALVFFENIRTNMADPVE